MIFRLLLFICLLPYGLFAQTTEACYERFLKEGEEARERFEFDLAINKFEAAKICPDRPLQNELDKLLEATNQAKIQALTEARDRAKKSEEQALLQLAVSESNRLAFLANREREKGNFLFAIKLAYHAMQLKGEQASPAVQRAFGDAVFRFTLRELKGHRQSLQSVVFSEDGRFILSTSRDSSLIVWTNSGEKKLHLRQFDHPIQSARFSPGGNQILTVSGLTIELWNLKGERIRSFEGHKDIIYHAEFSHDGELIASCSRDKSLRIWNRQSGDLKANCNDYAAAVTQLEFSKDGKKLLGVSSDKSIKIWTPSGKLLQTFNYHNQYLGGATFGPVEGQLLSYSADNIIQIWNIESGQLLNQIKKHRQLIRDIVPAPNQSGFISFSTDQMAFFWDASGKEIFQMDDHLAAIQQAVFSKDGQYILSYATDGSAKLYTQDNELLMDLSGFPGLAQGIAISPDNQQIAIAGVSSTLFLCKNPIPYYDFLKKNPPEEFTKEEKEKYALLNTIK